MSAYTLDAQDLLAESVQLAFRSLVTCYQMELQEVMPSFLEDRDDINEDDGTTSMYICIFKISSEKTCFEIVAFINFITKCLHFCAYMCSIFMYC